MCAISAALHVRCGVAYCSFGRIAKGANFPPVSCNSTEATPWYSAWNRVTLPGYESLYPLITTLGTMSGVLFAAMTAFVRSPKFCR